MPAALAVPPAPVIPVDVINNEAPAVLMPLVVIDRPFPVVKELEVIPMVVANVVETSVTWKAVPAAVLIPLKLKYTNPVLGTPVEPVVTDKALPVKPVAVAEIAKPFPVVRELALIFIAVASVVETS